MEKLWPGHYNAAADFDKNKPFVSYCFEQFFFCSTGLLPVYYDVCVLMAFVCMCFLFFFL